MTADVIAFPSTPKPPRMTGARIITERMLDALLALESLGARGQPYFAALAGEAEAMVRLARHRTD